MSTTTPVLMTTLAGLVAEEEVALVRRQAAALARLKSPRVGLRQIVEAALPEAIWAELGLDFRQARYENANHLTYLELASTLMVGEGIPLEVHISACTGWSDIEVVFSPAIARPRQDYPGELVYHAARLSADGPVHGNLAHLARYLWRAIQAHRTLIDLHPQLAPRRTAS